MFILLFNIFFLTLVITILLTHLFGAPYVPTGQRTIEKVIKLSGSLKNKKFADLGSGDGRVVGAFIDKKVEAHGYEVNPFLWAYSKLKWRKGSFHLKSFWDENLGKYDIVYFFGISYIMQKLEDKLKSELKKGSVVILHSYEFPNWKPIASDGSLYVYVV